MNPSTRLTCVTLAALMLTHCGGKNSPNPQTQSGAQMSSQGVAGTPAAPLGLYIANFLMQTPGSALDGAKNGVDAGISLLFSDRKTLSGSLLLMEQLGTVLQVDLPDFLNRSPDRQQTLDAYVVTLTELGKAGVTELAALKQQQTEAAAVVRDKRSITTRIQRDLSNALKNKDYTTASDLQGALGSAKLDQVQSETKAAQIQSLVSIFTNLNTVAVRRLSAIAANREVLIAGLQVVDMPGIEDLDVLKARNTRDSANNEDILGGTSN